MKVKVRNLGKSRNMSIMLRFSPQSSQRIVLKKESSERDWIFSLFLLSKIPFIYFHTIN